MVRERSTEDDDECRKWKEDNRNLFQTQPATLSSHQDIDRNIVQTELETLSSHRAPALNDQRIAELERRLELLQAKNSQLARERDIAEKRFRKAQDWALHTGRVNSVAKSWVRTLLGVAVALIVLTVSLTLYNSHAWRDEEEERATWRIDQRYYETSLQTCRGEKSLIVKLLEELQQQQPSSHHENTEHVLARLKDILTLAARPNAGVVTGFEVDTDKVETVT